MDTEKKQKTNNEKSNRFVPISCGIVQLIVIPTIIILIFGYNTFTIIIGIIFILLGIQSLYWGILGSKDFVKDMTTDKKADLSKYIKK